MFSRNRLVVFSLSLVALLMVGCGGGDDSVAPPVPEGPTYSIPDSTTVIPPEDSLIIQSYDPGNGAVTIDGTSEYAQDVAVGDIIIGQNETTAPAGFLRKITQKTDQRGMVVLQTEPAFMAEAFEEMSLSESVELRPSQVRSLKMINGSKFIADKSDKTFSVELGCVLYDQDGDESTTEDQIKLNGVYSFDAVLFADITIEMFELKKFETGIKTTKEATIDLKANLKWEFDRELSFDLAEFRLGAIPVGGVVWMVPTLTVKAFIHGDLTVTFETAVTYTETMTNGFGYANSEYYQVKSSSKNFNYTPPTLNAEFNFETGVSLNASCLIYGVAGPYMGGKAGFHFQAGLTVAPCNTKLDFDLDAILYAVVGIECDLLSLDYSQDYQLYLHNIGNWEIPLAGTGSITVVTGPGNLNPTWTLSGPCDYSHIGIGNAVVSNLMAGNYTIIWDDETGYTSPSGLTQSLAEEGALTFTGDFVQDLEPSSVRVVALPGELNAPWTLRFPSGETHSGTGTATFTGVDPGSFLIFWGAVEGYTSPPDAAQYRIGDMSLNFEGTYTVAPDTGRVRIDPQPSELDAPWVLTGPNDYYRSGHGYQSLSPLLLGEYFLAWGDVDDWDTPEDVSGVLEADGTMTFSETYIETVGTSTVTVNPDPDSVNAPWTLLGPDNFSYSGTGDEVLEEMFPGQYAMYWGYVSGWEAPLYHSQILEDESSIAFNGTYTEIFVNATAHIVPLPGTVNFPWTLTGPGELSISGNGEGEVLVWSPGQYTLTWNTVYGWEAPAAGIEDAVSGGIMEFAGTYTQNQAPSQFFGQVPGSGVSMPATFTMGLGETAFMGEHEVTLTNRFAMALTEVTNAQFINALQFAYDAGYVTATPIGVYDAMDGSTVALLNMDITTAALSFNMASELFNTTDPDRPVTGVSWYGAAAYCDWLSLQEGLTRAYNHESWSCNNGNPYGAAGYRLPTEAEWEFACRAGSETLFYTGDCLSSSIHDNFNGTYPYESCASGPSLGHVIEVGQYPANAWGLRDMQGNVSEWCNDYFSHYSGDETNPVGSPTAGYRARRGGSYSSWADDCLSATRGSNWPHVADSDIGFRPVRTGN